MSEKKPVPPSRMPARRLCPICHKPSYSHTGTHPQCSLAHADELSKAARKAEATPAEVPLAKKPWLKACPRCKRRVPARRFACDCGHPFAQAATLSVPGR